MLKTITMAAVCGFFSSAANAAEADVAEIFALTSGLGSTDTLTSLIVGLTITSVLLWCAYYLRRVMVNGFNRGDMPHIATGIFLSLTLLFLVLWVVGNHLN